MENDAFKRDAQIVLQRIHPWFKGLSNVFYYLIIVKDYYDHRINFYFEIKRKHQLTRAVPLHSIPIDFDRLIAILVEFRKSSQLAIVYRQFEKREVKLIKQGVRSNGRQASS
ncbi:hypothetical protein WR164_15550 [Philodulcilactobacillus myokoensis]|uniref:Uncharacterized protein n=1 Tax=Philodulcilactobacillus myokoensis TaxID=2929573 RepID=A0A9W6B2H9_9LACO|nr:hypothetical protein [Philodulcilactobacillus myokoensis]GLB47576.1 hypothetical protein WR164_15550 [Philodulcilactobacillus myokoensis]